MKEIVTSRLVLRQFNNKDFKDFYEYGIDKNVGPNAGWAPHKNEDESREIFKQFCNSDEVFAIELKEENKYRWNDNQQKWVLVRRMKYDPDISEPEKLEE